MRTKKELIEHLKNDIYCRVGVSKISGVGVIAIKNIPKGINPFKSLSHYKDKCITLDKNDVKSLDKNIVNLLHDFCGHKYGYDVLADGPNRLTISFYLNHSDNPNLDIIQTDNEYYGFVSNKIIKEGDELTINYKHYEMM